MGNQLFASLEEDNEDEEEIGKENDDDEVGKYAID